MPDRSFDTDTDTDTEIRARVAASPFHAWMGMRVVEVEAGRIVLALDGADRHRNLQGRIHGGVIATLADTAAGLAVRSAMDPGGRHVTVNLDVQYLRPARNGRLMAEGSVVRLGRSIGFADAEVTDTGGTVVARAQVTVAVSEGGWSEGPR